MAFGITAPVPYRWLAAGIVAMLVALLVSSMICSKHPIMPPSPTPPELRGDRLIVNAYLVSRGDPMPDCGTLAVSNEMIFTDEYADSATRSVLVPCAELPRPMYSSDAGNAPVLEVGHLYRLELVPAGVDRWRAARIDLISRLLD
jgi:hypothetical protein